MFFQKQYSETYRRDHFAPTGFEATAEPCKVRPESFETNYSRSNCYYNATSYNSKNRNLIHIEPGIDVHKGIQATPKLFKKVKTYTPGISFVNKCKQNSNTPASDGTILEIILSKEKVFGLIKKGENHEPEKN